MIMQDKKNSEQEKKDVNAPQKKPDKTNPINPKEDFPNTRNNNLNA